MELDLPASQPVKAIPLDEVGTDARTAEIHIGGSLRTCSVSFSACLPANRKGIHLSRLGEILHEAEESSFDSFQEVSIWLASEVKQRQQVPSAKVALRTVLYLPEVTPVSRKKTKKSYVFSLECTENSTVSSIRSTLEVPIIVACPCVQVNLEERIRSEIRKRKINPKVFEDIREFLPMPSHSQRAAVSVSLSASRLEVDPIRLVASIREVVTETYDLLKRSDEVEVVYRAHMKPQFCEDVTRDVLWAVFQTFRGSFAPQTIIGVKTVSEESIHSYNIFSSCGMTFGELHNL